MKVCVLSSGSKGNVAYLEINGKNFLLDAGRNYKYIENKMQEFNFNIANIDYIVITHDHHDHVSALKTLVTKTKAKIILSSKMHDIINDFGNNSYIICEDEIIIDDIKIKSIHSSHDALDSRNYIFSYKDKALAYITDTGYVNSKYFPILKNLDIYLFESNHDVELLQHGPYPKWLKKRILSDSGHLSNNMAGFYLAKLIGSKTKNVILIHLSETNNLEQIALNQVQGILLEYNVDFKNIICAKQDEITDMIEV